MTAPSFTIGRLSLPLTRRRHRGTPKSTSPKIGGSPPIFDEIPNWRRSRLPSVVLTPAPFRLRRLTHTGDCCSSSSRQFGIGDGPEGLLPSTRFQVLRSPISSPPPCRCLRPGDGSSANSRRTRPPSVVISGLDWLLFADGVRAPPLPPSLAEIAAERCPSLFDSPRNHSDSTRKSSVSPQTTPNSHENNPITPNDPER